MVAIVERRIINSFPALPAPAALPEVKLGVGCSVAGALHQLAHSTVYSGPTTEI
jgi:hypothetical protein